MYSFNVCMCVSVCPKPCRISQLIECAGENLRQRNFCMCLSDCLASALYMWVSRCVRVCAGVSVQLYLSLQMLLHKFIPASFGTVLTDSSILGCHGDYDGCVLGCHSDCWLGTLSEYIIKV